MRCEAELGDELADAGSAALVLLAHEAAGEFVLVEGDLGRRVGSAGGAAVALISGVQDLVVGCAENWKDQVAIGTESQGCGGGKRRPCRGRVHWVDGAQDGASLRTRPGQQIDGAPEENGTTLRVLQAHPEPFGLRLAAEELFALMRAAGFRRVMAVLYGVGDSDHMGLTGEVGQGLVDDERQVAALTPVRAVFALEGCRLVSVVA